MTLSGRKHKVTTSMRRLSPDASSPWSVGRSDERCERNVHSTYFHTKPSVSERLYGLRYHLRPLFHLYITHISQSHDPRNRLPQGSDRATISSDIAPQHATASQSPMKNLEVKFSLSELEFRCKNLFLIWGKHWGARI